jgi:putative MFS transporter
LQVDPAEIELPTEIGEVKRTPYRELFKFPRSMVTVLSSLGTQAAGNGIGLWAPTLLVLLLKIPPGRASFLMIWVAVLGFVGRFAWAYLSDAIGRRPSGILLSFGSAVICPAISHALAHCLSRQWGGAVHAPLYRRPCAARVTNPRA